MPVDNMRHMLLRADARFGAFWTVPVCHFWIQDQIKRMVIASKRKASEVASDDRRP